MHGNVAIFVPVSVLALWTFVVLLLIPLGELMTRRHGVAEPDRAGGEPAAAPTPASVQDRNFMNLLEAPVLFYVACIVLFVTGAASYLTIALAWVYVALRILHSIIHLTYNRVAHRSLVFGASNAVAIALWIVVVVHVTAAASVY